MDRAQHASLLLLALANLLARGAAAQTNAGSPAPAESAAAACESSAMIHDTVELVLYLTSASDSSHPLPGKLAAQAVADNFRPPTRLSLGAAEVGWDPELVGPNGWGAVTGLAAELDLQVDRQGDLIHALVVESARTPELNAGLLDAARRADSVGGLLPHATGKPKTIRLRVGAGTQPGDLDAPLMRLTFPYVRISEPVSVVHVPAPQYPPTAWKARIQSSVDLQYVVDENGRAVPSSVKVLKAEYAEFIASAVQAILHAEYTPARSGGCPVRQMIRQRVSFKIG
jgi:TonB family protein